MTCGIKEKVFTGRSVEMISDMRLRIESFSLSEFREYLIAKESTEATIQKYINDTKRFFEFLGER